ncbi:MAG TPA: signal peptidase I [Candidatus Omnitrophota bacterium]|nr:signal peptidase I [Candidatus Omnitrophota bacterium]
MHSNDVLLQDAVAILIKEGLAKGKHPEFQIISSSMHPTLQPGDRIFVKQYTASNPSCGDIITYKLNKNIIAHRFLYQQDENFFIAQGDNTKKIDPPVPNDALFGKIVAIERDGYKVNLETKKWNLTNKIIADILISKTKDKNFFAKLLCCLRSELFQIYLLIINPEYRRLSKTVRTSLLLEKELLKICSKKELNSDDIKSMKEALTKNINWDKFLWLALYNSVAPIVFISLSKIKDNNIPEEIMQKFKDSYTESFLKTAPIYDDLANLLKELNLLQVKTIVLKGCSLAEQLYGDFSLRPMKDIDILVKKQDWPKIREVLDKLNFKAEKDLLELENSLGAPSDWHLCYRNSRDTKIEFKFNLFILDFPDFDSSDYWQEAITIKVNNVEALSLSVEDQIIYLSSRMINVGFRNLLWFCDLRELISNYRDKIDWGKIILKAKNKRVSIAVYNSLLILNNELSTGIPNNVLVQLKPPIIQKNIFHKFYSLKYPLFWLPENIFNPNPIISLCLVFGKFSFWPKDIAKLIRYAWKILFPPSSYISYRYNLPKKPGVIIRWYFYRFREFLIRFLLLGRIFNRRPVSL